MKQLFDNFFKALSAKDYVQSLIIVVLIVAYFSRSDKQEAEKSSRIASEICRADRIRSDSIWQVRFDKQGAAFQARLDDVTERYINSLRGINTRIDGAVEGIKTTSSEKAKLSVELNRKYNRNSNELNKIVTEKREQQ